MAAGVDDMPTHQREPGVKDLMAYWKEASPMSNRDFGVAASAHHPTGP